MVINVPRCPTGYLRTQAHAKVRVALLRQLQHLTGVCAPYPDLATAYREPRLGITGQGTSLRQLEFAVMVINVPRCSTGYLRTQAHAKVCVALLRQFQHLTGACAPNPDLAV